MTSITFEGTTYNEEDIRELLRNVYLEAYPADGVLPKRAISPSHTGLREDGLIFNNGNLTRRGRECIRDILGLQAPTYDTQYRGCGVCPYMALNEHGTPCCTVYGIVGVATFGCTPSRIPEYTNYRNMSPERRVQALAVLIDAPIRP